MHQALKPFRINRQVLIRIGRFICHFILICNFYYSAVSTTTVVGIPAIPTGLTSPASDTNGAYTVSWNSSNGATSYNLQRKLNSGGWSTIQTGGSTSRAESGLGTGDYSYRVRACSSAGCSSYSAAKTTIVLFAPFNIQCAIKQYQHQHSYVMEYSIKCNKL